MAIRFDPDGSLELSEQAGEEHVGPHTLAHRHVRVADEDELDVPQRLPLKDRPSYRPDVDGLRAVAVTAVIIYHIDHALLPGGFVGVDMFFVVSGFVVTGSLLRRQSSCSELYLDFYARRVRRLWPALALTVLVSALVISTVVPVASSLLDTYASGQLALLGVANVRYALRELDYWEQGVAGLEFNPFTHMWSLGVEEQFYLVFPAILRLAYGGHRAPLPLLVASGALSLLLSAFLSVQSPRFAFYLLPSRFWQLILGAVVFEISEMRERQKVLSDAASSGRALAVMVAESLVFVCFVLAITLTRGERLFPVPWSLLAVGATAGYIALGSEPPQRWRCGLPRPLLNACLAWAPIAYVGRLSCTQAREPEATAKTAHAPPSQSARVCSAQTLSTCGTGRSLSSASGAWTSNPAPFASRRWARPCCSPWQRTTWLSNPRSGGGRGAACMSSRACS